MFDTIKLKDKEIEELVKDLYVGESKMDSSEIFTEDVKPPEDTPLDFDNGVVEDVYKKTINPSYYGSISSSQGIGIQAVPYPLGSKVAAKKPNP